MRRLALLLWLCCCVGTAGAATQQGEIFVVIDGDTVLFKPEPARGSRRFLKLRLVGIDAPEQQQTHGDIATQVLSQWVLNQRVQIDTLGRDTYGRTLARIARDGRDINLELVREGHAWASGYRRPAADLRAAQHAARTARLGLWRTSAPMPPWQWRRTHQNVNPASASK